MNTIEVTFGRNLLTVYWILSLVSTFNRFSKKKCTFVQKVRSQTKDFFPSNKKNCQNWPSTWHALKYDYAKHIQVKQMLNEMLNTYRQTWGNDHLRITTTCLKRPSSKGPIFYFFNIKLPLNNDHLQTTVINLGPEGSRCTQVWPYKIRIKKVSYKLLFFHN